MLRSPLAIFIAAILGGTPLFAQRSIPGMEGTPGQPNDREIKPPFSLEWGEDSRRVEAKIAAAKLFVAERRRADSRLALVVTGFKKPDAADPKAPKPPELRRVIFYFNGGKLAKEKGADGVVAERISGGALVEVELQYEQAGWSEQDYNTCLGEKRQLIERSHGPGQMIARDTSPTPDGKTIATLVGYRWNKNNTAVELVYFNAEAKSENRTFHTLSLHYKVAM